MRGGASEVVPAEVPSMNWKTFSTPSPLAALISATGAPSSLASSAVSTWPPRLLQIVRHVEDDQRRQFQAENRRGQHQMAAEVGAIQNQQHASGLGMPGMAPGQDVARDLLVFRARIQAVDAGQVHQDDFAVVDAAFALCRRAARR